MTEPDSPASCPASSSSPSARFTTPSTSSMPPAAAPGTAGTSTTPTFTWAASASSARGITPISSTPGSPLSTVSQQKLATGAFVADVGCGHGASTILMAQAFPASTFVGSDYHSASIEIARDPCRRGGCRRPRSVRGRLRAGVRRHGGYDLVAMFDCLHDMGDPVGQRGMCARPSPMTAPGWSSSRWRRPRRRQPQPGGAGCTTASRRCCAPRRRSRRMSGSPSARRPVPRASGTSPRPVVSPASAASPRRPSTACSKSRP